MRYAGMKYWLVLCVLITASPCFADNVQFTLEASTPTHSAATHMFGWHSDAATGVDVLDIPEPPLPPNDYLAFAFIRNDLTPNRWRADIRSLADFDDSMEHWDIRVQTDAPAATCVVSITMETDDPALYIMRVSGLTDTPFTVNIPGQFSIDLVDATTDFGFNVVSVGTPNEPKSWSAIKGIYR